MNAQRDQRRMAVLRLQQLEERTVPAAFNTLVSRSEPTLSGDTSSGNSYVEFDPSISHGPTAQNISADGQYVAFQSNATNVVAGQTDNNNAYDVFLYDR